MTTEDQLQTGRPGLPGWARIDSSWALVADATKFRDELGWRPGYPDFDDGLRARIAWYRANESCWAPAKDATEAFYARLGQ